MWATASAYTLAQWEAKFIHASSMPCLQTSAMSANYVYTCLPFILHHSLHTCKLKQRSDKHAVECQRWWNRISWKEQAEVLVPGLPHTHIWLWEKLATMISNGQSSNCLLPVGNGRVQLGLLDPCIPVVPSPHLPHGLGQLAMPMTLAKVDLQEACRLVVAEHPPPKVNSEAMTTSISGSPSIFTSPMPSAGGSLSANMLANRVAQNGREWWCLGDVLLLMFFGGFLDVVGGRWLCWGQGGPDSGLTMAWPLQ